MPRWLETPYSKGISEFPNIGDPSVEGDDMGDPTSLGSISGAPGFLKIPFRSSKSQELKY